MKKILMLLIVLTACVACLSSCKLINSIFPCKHKETVIDDAVAPTCTETGLTEGSHCIKCGEAVVAQQTVPATGHKEVLQEAVAPTCTEDGLSAGVYCSVCNTTIIAQEPVPAGHTFTDWKTVTEPDCFFPGEETRICKVCDTLENRDVEPIAHRFVQNDETNLFSCELCNAVIYAGHLYAAIEQPMHWFEAYEMCENLGGYLATITSSHEQNVIANMIIYDPDKLIDDYYLGGIKNSNGWEWITGESFTYSNWASGQPQNGKIEWFLGIKCSGVWHDYDYNSHSLFTICEWELDIVESEHYFTEWETTTEASCFGDGEEYRICTHCGLEETRVVDQLKHNFVFNEVTGVTSCERCCAAMYQGRIYAIFTEQVSWYDAYKRCEELGGHLATITSTDEQTFIESFMTSISYNSRAWLGGLNDGTSWRWVTGEKFESINGSFADCANGTEYFLEINYLRLGQWNDLIPTAKLYFICEWEAE